MKPTTGGWRFPKCAWSASGVDFSSWLEQEVPASVRREVRALVDSQVSSLSFPLNAKTVSELIVAVGDRLTTGR